MYAISAVCVLTNKQYVHTVMQKGVAKKNDIQKLHNKPRTCRHDVTSTGVIVNLEHLNKKF
jgi:hypothetical protein